MNETMAMANLDIAIDQLKRRLNCGRFPLHKRDVNWAIACCVYSRFIHVIIWHDLIPRKEVKDNIIPLLEEAGKEVGKLEDITRFNQTEKETIIHAKKNINFRIDNLSLNYLNRKPSDFPPEAIEIQPIAV